MSTPLQQDVRDVTDALDSLGALFLLTGGRTLRTKTGCDLAAAVYAELRHRTDVATRAHAEAQRLAAEVDGLRNQNEMMTDREVAG